MPWPEDGKYYNIINKGTGFGLNQFASGKTDGTNVTQWAVDLNDTDQQWLFTNDRFYPKNVASTLGNSSVKHPCLDRYITRDANYNNADLWDHTDSVNQMLLFIEDDDDCFFITLKFAEDNLYLTASSNPTGASSSNKAPGSAGNVYWAPYDDGNALQLWRFSEVGTAAQGGQIGGIQRLIMPYDVYNFINAGYKSEGYRVDTGWIHFGTDILNVYRLDPSSGSNTVEGSGKFRASGNGRVVGFASNTFAGADRPERDDLGNVLAVQYDNVVDNNGNYLGSVIIKYCHIKSINVTKGQEVTPGMILGERGATGGGASAGAHLHLEISTDTANPLYSESERDYGYDTNGQPIEHTLDPLDVFYHTNAQVIGFNTTVINNSLPMAPYKTIPLV